MMAEYWYGAVQRSLTNNFENHKEEHGRTLQFSILSQGLGSGFFTRSVIVRHRRNTVSLMDGSQAIKRTTVRDVLYGSGLYQAAVQDGRLGKMCRCGCKACLATGGVTTPYNEVAVFQLGGSTILVNPRHVAAYQRENPKARELDFDSARVAILELFENARRSARQPALAKA